MRAAVHREHEERQLVMVRVAGERVRREQHAGVLAHQHRAFPTQRRTGADPGAVVLARHADVTDGRLGLDARDQRREPRVGQARRDLHLRRDERAHDPLGVVCARLAHAARLAK